MKGAGGLPGQGAKLIDLGTMTKNNNVLIVDDDADAREILARIVRTLGLETQMASDGLEVIEMLQGSEVEVPDLILLDLLMPGMDGFGVYSWLVRNPNTRRVPIIVVTACNRHQIDMLKLPGVVDVIRKGTFSIQSLSELVANTLHIDLLGGTKR